MGRLPVHASESEGVSLERWVHAVGCRQWFNLARSTVTHEILAVYPMGAPAPRLDAGSDR